MVWTIVSLFITSYTNGARLNGILGEKSSPKVSLFLQDISSVVLVAFTTDISCLLMGRMLGERRSMSVYRNTHRQKRKIIGHEMDNITNEEDEVVKLYTSVFGSLCNAHACV